MVKSQNKYKTQSTRFSSWNYGWNGSYFITICTHHHLSSFGNIQNDRMCLSNAGIIVDILWHEIPHHARDIRLSKFVVMPNHIHGILILDGGNCGNTGIVENNTTPPSIGCNRFQNQGKNTISSIVGSYKSAVTRHANRLGFDFKWQTNFWEHIIRDENEFGRISEYIVTNPARWQQDKLNNDPGNSVLEPCPPYNEEIWMV